MHKLYCILPVQTGIDFFFEFFKIACGALRVKQVAAGDVMFILLVIWLCNGEGAKLVLETPFSR